MGKALAPDWGHSVPCQCSRLISCPLMPIASWAQSPGISSYPPCPETQCDCEENTNNLKAKREVKGGVQSAERTWGQKDRDNETDGQGDSTDMWLQLQQDRANSSMSAPLCLHKGKPVLRWMPTSVS
ncbi:hypothetical protein MHYP_G00114110 [Metynnis hypsauchen]